MALGVDAEQRKVSDGKKHTRDEWLELVVDMTLVSTLIFLSTFLPEPPYSNSSRDVLNTNS